MISFIHYNNLPSQLECRAQRQKVKTKLNAAKSYGWDIHGTEYKQHKNVYHKLIREKRESYITAQQNKINCSRNSKEFWVAINTFRRAPKKIVHVSDDDWMKFYTEILPQRTYCGRTRKLH